MARLEYRAPARPCPAPRFPRNFAVRLSHGSLRHLLEADVRLRPVLRHVLPALALALHEAPVCARLLRVLAGLQVEGPRRHAASRTRLLRIPARQRAQLEAPYPVLRRLA